MQFDELIVLRSYVLPRTLNSFKPPIKVLAERHDTGIGKVTIDLIREGPGELALTSSRRLSQR